MNSYIVPLTCPRCGEPLNHAADGKPSTRIAQAVASCATCGQFLVSVTIGPMYPEAPPVGVGRGYRR